MATRNGSKVDGSLKSLLQGVSQQPPRDRLTGQCTEQINMSCDPISGLIKRPPTDLVSVLGPVQSSSFYDFQTRDGRKWLIQFNAVDGIAKAFDLNGNPFPCVTTGAARDYIINAADGEGTGTLRFSTVDEETFVVNPAVVTRMLPNTVQYWNRQGSKQGAIIQVLGGNYGRVYTIRINGGVIASYKVPDGSEPEHADFVGTSWIAAQLALAADTSLGPDWTVNLKDDVILITRLDGALFDLSCSDDAGNTNMKSMVNQVKNISELPRYAPSGYVVRIATKADPDEDAFYRFSLEQAPDDLSGAGFGNAGYWQEAVSPGIKYLLDQYTMPCILTYNPSTVSFQFDIGNWIARKSGSTISNPEPSFIGSRINDVGTFQGRLVFVAGSNVIMSRTNFYKDFWIRSVSALADTDPIDISSSTVEAAAMQCVIPHNKDLVIFSAKGQFVVYGRTSITPKNAALVLTTSFEAELSAKPVAAGRNVFFATNYGRFTNMREFYTEGGTDINDTRPITQHVKEYLVGKARKLSATSNYDMLIACTTQDRDNLYVYQYIWADNEKVQSAWHKWQMSHVVYSTFFDEEQIYFITETLSGFTLLRMSLDVQDEEGVTYPAYMDNRFDVLGCYTQFLLPYPYLSRDDLVIVQGTGCPNPGMLVKLESLIGGPDGVVATLATNMQGGRVICGTPMSTYYEPTMPMVKDSEGVVIGTGKLRVKNFILSLEDTGHIKTQVKSKFYPQEAVEFSGRMLNSLDNLVGVPAIYTGPLTVPFREDTQLASLMITSTSHTPLAILDIEWVGQYAKRGRRINQGGN